MHTNPVLSQGLLLLRLPEKINRITFVGIRWICSARGRNSGHKWRVACHRPQLRKDFPAELVVAPSVSYLIWAGTMKIAEIPAQERQRITVLHALNILDTPPEERFDRLTRLARRLFSVPIAVVSLIDSDRQWFKSHPGLDVCETSRDVSFCAHAILGNDTMVVDDALEDSRFQDNPLVTGPPGIRFYAGCPIGGADGTKFGTLCVIDTVPRQFSDEDRALLRDLAGMVEQELIAVQLATMDELTGLSNRRGFEALVQYAMSMCKRTRQPAVLIYVDLDWFKQINDRFGHAEGDRALRDFAGLLAHSFRESDVIGRIGGDEFSVFLTNARASEAQVALSHLEQAVNSYNQAGQRGYDLRYSAGLVEYDPIRHDTIAALMHAADALMYQQKQHRHAMPREGAQSTANNKIN